MRFRLRSKSALAVFLIIAIVAAVGTTAFFADRASHQITFTTATFTQDGYSLSRTASDGPFVSGEDVTFTLKETNTKSEDISSIVTMHITWNSPDKASHLFSDTSKAEITVAGVCYDYPSQADNTLALVVSEHVLSAGLTADTPISIHIPETLKATGNIIVTFENVVTRQYPSGFSYEYDRDKLNAEEALDFTARVGWAAAKTTFSVQTEKAIMAYLTETNMQDSYGMTMEMSFGYTKSPMKDFFSVNETPWSQYAAQITNLYLCEGMTTIGNSVFCTFEGVTTVTIPNTVTSIGEDAFAESGLIGEVVIPKTVTEIKSGAFSAIFADTFTFEHGPSDTLTLPDSFFGGAFSYIGTRPNEVLETMVNTTNLDIKYGYKWHNDLRRGTPVLAKQDTWYTQGSVPVFRSSITSIEIKDYYEPSDFEYSWDASDKTNAFPNTVTAYLEKVSDQSRNYKLTIAGNGYGCVIANKDSSDAFSGFSSAVELTGTSLFSLHDTGYFQFPATTSLAGMFYFCNALENIDVSTWDVSSVLDTSWMFAGCNAVKVLDLSTWETDSLENTASMFNSMHESAAGVLEKIDLTGWNTANVTDMSQMFYGRPALTEIKGLSGFNTSKVKDMSGMFSNCYALPNIDLSGFSTVLVQNMREMFRGCRAFTALDLSHFSTTGITSADNLKRFASGCTSLTTITFGPDFGQSGKIPAEGVFSGMFYVSDYLKTNIINANDVMKVGIYDWITENRWKIGIIDAELSYEDVLVGETVDAQLDLLPGNHDLYQSIQYEVLTGGQYAKVNKNTGVVTGLKAGTATVRVTIVDANGETISADGTVRVYNIGVTKATLDYDDVQVGETVDPQLSLFPVDHDDCQSITYEVVSGGQYAKVHETTGVVIGLKPGEATIRVTIIDANGDEVTADGTVTVYAIGITNAALKYDDVRVNETVDPQLTVLPTDRDPDKSKTYAIITGSEYAKVNASTGVVTGLKPGTATVRVTIIDANGMQLTANANVKVYAVGATSATLAYNDVRVGKTVNPQSQILPADRELDKRITYAVLSGSEYAKVDASSGIVTGFKPGTAVIRMTVEDANGNTVTADGPVKVYAIGAASATLAYNDVQVGKTVDPKYSILPTDRDPDKSMTFSIVSGDTYAKVDPFTGVVTGLTPGTATVRLTVTDANGAKITADGTVKVYAIGVTDASLAYNDVRVGETVSAQLQITPAQRDPDKSMTYSLVSDSEYAKVDASTGIVTGLKPGIATVRVTIVDANGQTVTADANVKVYSIGATSKVFAVYSAVDGSLMFYNRKDMPNAGDSYNGKTATAVYTGFDTTVYASYGYVPWYNNRSTIKSVSFVDKISPVSTAYWFYGAETLSSFNPANLDTNKTTNMKYMFYNCKALTRLDLSAFVTNQVKDMQYMFYNCQKLTSLNVGSFITSQVTSMQGMFWGCYVLPSLDISSFNTEKVTNMRRMFYRCEMLTSLDCSSFKTGKVTSMEGMFDLCQSLISLDISNFETDLVTNMSNMFYYCEKLKSLDVSHFSTGNVTTMKYMFFNCNVVNSLDVSNFDTKNVKDMSYMFTNMDGLTSLDCSSFDTSKVTTMEMMFCGLEKIVSLNVSSFDTSNVTIMTDMFSGCQSLPKLDISSFNTSKVTDMNDMFSLCNKLVTIYASELWSTALVAPGTEMFDRDYVLKGAISYNANKLDVAYANYKTGYFTYKAAPASVSALNIKLDTQDTVDNMENCSEIIVDMKRSETGSDFNSISEELLVFNELLDTVSAIKEVDISSLADAKAVLNALNEAYDDLSESERSKELNAAFEAAHTALIQQIAAAEEKLNSLSETKIPVLNEPLSEDISDSQSSDIRNTDEAYHQIPSEEATEKIEAADAASDQNISQTESLQEE